MIDPKETNTAISQRLNLVLGQGLVSSLFGRSMYGRWSLEHQWMFVKNQRYSTSAASTCPLAIGTEFQARFLASQRGRFNEPFLIPHDNHSIRLGPSSVRLFPS